MPLRVVKDEEASKDRQEAAALLRHLAEGVEEGHVSGFLALFSHGPEDVGDGATISQINHGWSNPESLWAMQTVTMDWVRPDPMGEPLGWDEEDEP